MTQPIDLDYPFSYDVALDADLLDDDFFDDGNTAAELVARLVRSEQRTSRVVGNGELLIAALLGGLSFTER